MIFTIKIDATGKTSSSSKYNNVMSNNYNNKNYKSYIIKIRTLKKENDNGLGENNFLIFF